LATDPANGALPATPEVARDPAPPDGSAAGVGTTVAQVTLHLHSKPEGAMIVIDQKPIGVTPIDAVVPRGAKAVVIGARLGARTATQKLVPDHDRDVTLAMPTGHAAGSTGSTASSPGGTAAGSDDQVPF
jgi:hypothetical protein